MPIVDVYPLITVTRLADSRDFFVKHFGLSIIFEASWIAMLSASDRGSIALGLMSPDHPSRPPGREPFNGSGMIVTLQVDDAAAALTRMTDATVVHPLSIEPWGQRRFMLRDPSGILVDVVEQIEPKPGFWDDY